MSGQHDQPSDACSIEECQVKIKNPIRKEDRGAKVEYALGTTWQIFLPSIDSYRNQASSSTSSDISTAALELFAIVSGEK